MKYFLLLLLPLLLQCSPDRDNQRQQGEPEISFDIAGKHYSHTGQLTATNLTSGISAIKYPGDVLIKAYYGFFGLTNASNTIMFDIISDSLQTATYTTDKVAAFVIKADGVFYALNEDATITITSYKNGVVSGVFSGGAKKVISFNPDVTEPATISNGEINNVKLVYQ